MSIAPNIQSTLTPNLAIKTKTTLSTRCSYLLGHRGARGEILENSMAGFAHLQQLSQQHPNQVVGIEFDVQLTADNRLFVYHDDTLMRLHQRQSRLDQCTQQELLRPNIQQSYQHLFLEDTAPYLMCYQRIELEIKTHNRTNYQRLVYALQHTLLNSHLSLLPITLTSFDITLHQHLQNNQTLKHFPRGLLVEPNRAKSKPIKSSLPATTATDLTHLGLQTLMTTHAPLSDTALVATRLGCQGVGLYFGLFNPALSESSFTQQTSIAQTQVTQQLMHSLQRHQLTTTVWTVNTAQHIQYFIELGVNYIISDYPSKFIACF